MGLSKSGRIQIMLAIDATFLILEMGVGIAVGSLALLADAFHMLNDIISLAVGLWAVKAAQRSSSDKYSFGYLRAEILGAGFNAVFLIALCLSIVIEAIQRLIDPPEISNPKLILIVGCLGLASNLGGFIVLGGHGHSHGPEGHSHSHGDEISAAEDGHSHSHGHEHDHNGHNGHEHTYDHDHDEERETTVSKVKSKSSHHLRFSEEDNHHHGSNTPVSLNRSVSRSSDKKQHRRRGSSIRAGRLTNIDDLSIHPASFRQEIIAASKPQLDGIDSDDNAASEEEVVAGEDDATENSPLLAANGKSDGNGTMDARKHSHDDEHDHGHSHSHPHRQRHDSWHVGHNHTLPKKPKKSGGHSHDHGDMGMNAMILHVIGDALGNVGVIVSALIIWLSDWSGRYYADPAVSLFITIIILRSTIPLTKATAKILLQATPDHIDVPDIKEDIQKLPGVISCHHIHIWQLSEAQVVASMHIQVEFPISEAGGEKYMELAKAVRKCLHAYGIHSATIQPEFCLDKDHNHDSSDGGVGLDGIVGQPRCGLDDDSCLLECVDNCTGKGCCSPKTVEQSHSHDNLDHEHDQDHDHEHDHSDHGHTH